MPNIGDAFVPHDTKACEAKGGSKRGVPPNFCALRFAVRGPSAEWKGRVFQIFGPTEVGP